MKTYLEGSDLAAAVVQVFGHGLIRRIADEIRQTRRQHPAEATCECQAMDALKLVLPALAAAGARGWANAVEALRDEDQRAEERFRLSRPEGTEWDAYDAAADYLEWFAAQEAHDG